MKFKVVDTFSINGNTSVQLDRPAIDRSSHLRVNGEPRQLLGVPMTPPTGFGFFFLIEGKVKKSDIIEFEKAD